MFQTHGYSNNPGWSQPNLQNSANQWANPWGMNRWQPNNMWQPQGWTPQAGQNEQQRAQPNRVGGSANTWAAQPPNQMPGTQVGQQPTWAAQPPRWGSPNQWAEQDSWGKRNPPQRPGSLMNSAMGMMR